jgi:hypothetical protein
MVMYTAVIGPDAERRTVAPADCLAGTGHHWPRGKGSALTSRILMVRNVETPLRSSRRRLVSQP